ncbi:MAG: hypothetical protein FWE78_03270, partial [Methanimicrococcus sp.]|nr:hypothetical protein [Methanimicrococcus sp.]
HICMCIFFIIPTFILYEIGSWSYEIFIWVAMGAYTLIALLLYFLAGKLFLRNTHNTLTNVFSTIALVIILVNCAYSWYDPPPANLPFYSLLGVISLILQLPNGAVAEEIAIYLVLTPLPSLLMLAGLMVKQRREKLNKTESQDNELLESADESFENEEDVI